MGFAHLPPPFFATRCYAVLTTQVLPHSCTQWRKFIPRWPKFLPRYPNFQPRYAKLDSHISSNFDTLYRDSVAPDALVLADALRFCI